MTLGPPTELGGDETARDQVAPHGALITYNYDIAEVTQVFHDLVDGLPEQIALVDDRWTVLTVNRAWNEAVAQYGYFDLQPGANYLEFCRERAAEGHSPAASAFAAITEMDAVGGTSARFVYSGTGPGEGREFELCINRLRIAGNSFATITRYDITELAQLRRARQEFSQAIIEEQLAERRRMAREIHDSTAQLLACIGLGLGQLKRAAGQRGRLRVVTELEGLLGETQREIRSISYLSHPPELEKLGLAEALRTLAAGFGRRTNLDIAFEVEKDFRPPDELGQLAIYRIVQEALSNIHRHSGASRASLRLVSRRGATHVVIADNGVGFASDEPKGVGLAGMRARISEMRGRLTIRSANAGTVIILSLLTAR